METSAAVHHFPQRGEGYKFKSTPPSVPTLAKKVPLAVVENKQDAAFEITGVAGSQKAGTAKKIITGSWHSKEEASIKVVDVKTGVVVFAYSYTTENSTHGKRSSAEACAKHLKDAVKSLSGGRVERVGLGQ